MAEDKYVPFAETQIGSDGLRHPTAELQKDNDDFKEAAKAQKAAAKESEKDETVPDTRVVGDQAEAAIRLEQGDMKSGDHATGTGNKPSRGQHQPSR